MNLRDPGNPELPEHRFENNIGIGRYIRFGATKVKLGLEVFNIENLASITARNLTYDPRTPEALATYYRPTQITPARFWKFSMQFDF